MAGDISSKQIKTHSRWELDVLFPSAESLFYHS
jgi:hypothetical protein